MNRHNFDPKTYDFTWKQNRLSKDKEALKASLLNIIHKKPKKQHDQNANDQGYKKPDETSPSGIGVNGTPGLGMTTAKQ